MPTSVRFSARLGLGVGAIALVGCVGDTPINTPQPDATADGPVIGTDGGADVVTPDAAPDAGPPPCGAPGESCCVAPLAPCGDGLTCTTNTKKCAVSDAWAIGEYATYAPNNGGFVTQIVTAHYDGATWTQGKEVLTDFGFTTYRAQDIYQSGDLVRALVTKASNIGGKMYGWNSVSWAECKSGGSCIGPTTNADLWAVTSVLNGGNTEFWVAGTNVMYRCPNGNSSCSLVTNGIVGGVGTSTFAGTTAQDLWYGVGDHVLRFNGTAWSSMSVGDAATMGDVAKDDIWIGSKQLRHWDGNAWSNAFLVDGALTPGLIFSISGAASKDVFAVGNDSGVGSFAAHWDGTGWKKTTLPAGTAGVTDVWAPSPIEAFVVGRKEPATNKAVIARWDGTTWTEMPTPSYTYPQEQSAGTLKWVAITGRARPRRAP